ncbi:Alpha-humulene/(-)-(E)-beta-caryophyllene synthase [Striga hermonthica]|uniref:Alpha-humulene/(-)-(E)-beta-caryophyllene synthase n=1 Tax=Striga hermonthica TaxID=68872 RepID=A0A9N7MJU4_STRHE|nr:Alpha-humulene/(-)-(E)-beta-caryophyllene synthase [Striga hermonthica]
MTRFEFEAQGYDLFTTALGFRILRQHHHYVSHCVFDKFIDQQDKRFKETLGDDAKGLLSLYEAAHLRTHGEQILDEAVTFTVHNLKRMVQQLESPLQDLVKRALERPLHRGLPRMETRHYISFYEKYDSKNEQLLRLAKLDFNQVQSIYKNELHELTRWWNELNPQLPYARNRIVAAYLWGVASHFEPQYSYMIDICSAYNKGLKYTMGGEVPSFEDYIQMTVITSVIYVACAATFAGLKSVCEETINWFKSEPKIIRPLAEMKDICSAYNKGLKYTMGGEGPSFEDYIQMTVITSVIYVACAATFAGLKSVCEETIDWFKSEPKIIRPLAEVCRYLDDIGSYERESQEGALLIGLDFYVKDHGGSMEEAKDKFVELAEDAWKHFNGEWITNVRVSGVPKDVAEELIGYARAAEIFYRNGRDGYAKCHAMAPEIKGILVDPVIV